MESLIFDAPHEQQLPLVSQAADVVHHLANGHRFLKIDQIADIAADIVIQIQQPVLPQQQNGKYCKLLGDGGYVKNTFRGDGNLMFQVGIAEGLFVENLPSLADQNLGAWADTVLPLGRECVQRRFQLLIHVN